MAKDLSGATTAATAIDAQQKQPVILFDLFLTEPTLTLRFCAYKKNLTFDGNTYSAKNILFDGSSQSLEGQIGRITIRFDNVSRDMAAYANSNIFEGRRITVRRVYLDSFGNPPTIATDFISIFDGSLETPSEISREFLTVPATTGKALKKRVLLKTYNKKCNHVFGDEQCNSNGNSDIIGGGVTMIITGQVDSTSAAGTTMWDSTSLTQASDYWNFGAITVGNSGTSYSRIVEDFVALAGSGVTLDLSIPVAITTAPRFRYEITKGCAKTLSSCTAENAFGPLATNHLNFGGFIHIGAKKPQ